MKQFFGETPPLVFCGRSSARTGPEINHIYILLTLSKSKDINVNNRLMEKSEYRPLAGPKNMCIRFDQLPVSGATKLGRKQTCNELHRHTWRAGAANKPPEALGDISGASRRPGSPLARLEF